MPSNSKYNKKIGDILANISEEDRTVLTTKQFRGSFKLPVLIKKMRNLGLYDLYADQQRSVYDKRFSFGCVSALAIGFIGFICFVNDIIAGLTFAMLLVVPCFLGLLVMRWMNKSSDLAEKDLKNEFRNFLVPLFAALGEDIMPNSKVFLDAAVDDPMHDKYLLSNTEPEGPVRQSIYSYHQNWITASMLFVDRVRLSFEVERAGSKIYTTKRRSSGKTKTKGKFKMRTNVQLRMLVPKSHYKKSGQRAAKQDESRPFLMSFEEQADNFVIKAKYKRKGLPTDHIAVEEFLGLIRQMYSTIQPI